MSDIEQDARQWIMNEMYGMKTVPPNEEYEAFLKAVLICAKGDGLLAPEERNWVAGRAAAYRNPGYELAKTYEPNEDLQDVVNQASALSSNPHIVIYVAIQACSADKEYHAEEKAAVRKLAKYIGIEEDVVTQIEELYMEEAKIREKRIALMFPNGVPY
ncbi:TerB family tellurite resistance protein [Coleofasciculus sp. F4-SAH-05]|uniref:TerB family tellurite resistance protein n=1 Tax=Coleofasciculus sp. F4-SAH-05 TaxID=3069525 RepID=UPI0032F2DA6D